MSRNYVHIHSRLGFSDNEDASKPPQILSILATVMEKSMQRNEKVLKRSRTKESVTIFHGTNPPTLNIRQYVERIFKYSYCSNSCFVVAYIYMDRYVQQTGCYLTSLNAHRLLITCFLVAAKFLEDECYSNAYFSKIGGISIAEMNKLELKLLLSLDHRLHVSLETFNQYCTHLEECALNGNRSQLERANQSGGLKGSCRKKDRTKCNQRFDEYTCRAM